MATAAESGENKPVELPEWVQNLMHGGAIPFSEFHHGSPGWASPPGDAFLVRGSGYSDTNVKVPAGEWLLQPLAVDCLQSSSKIVNVMRHPDCRVRAALEAALKARELRRDTTVGIDPSLDRTGDEKPFVWAFNFQLCDKENHSLVVYYVSFHSPSKGSLMQRFLEGDDAFRNSRLKVITKVAEGPWIVKAAIGERWPACRVGKILECTYSRDEHYIEVDMDMWSSVLARTTIQLTIGLTPHVIVDLAFVLEGHLPHELPERVLGAIRFAKLDLSSANFIDSPKDKPHKRSLWDSLSNGLHRRKQDVGYAIEEEKQGRK
eukprot:c6460_g1_i1 orf=253-1209(-)